MALGSALSSAASGLNAVSRQLDITSLNIANAATEGFARREVELASQVVNGAGNGVKVEAIQVASTPALTRDRRAADADVGFQNEILNAAEITERLVGGPDDPSALFTRFQEFETSLRALADRPQESALQYDVVRQARDLVEGFNQVSDGLNQIREDADRAIALQVDEINRVLPEIARLNREIERTESSGVGTSEIEAQRDVLVDQLASIIPITVDVRDNGTISVSTLDGVNLINSEAAVFGFTQATVVQPNLSVGAGTLSTLTLDGIDVTPSTVTPAVFDSGSLAALFEVRDVAVVETQTQIDALAEDLISRFSAPGVEPFITVPPDAGLFTDGGGAPTGAPGLAGRLSVNALVDPDAGGSLEALSNGINFTPPAAPTGDNSHEIALLGAATSAGGAPPGSGVVGDGSFADFLADFSSNIASERLAADQTLSLRTGRQAVLSEEEALANGVDIDSELQFLTFLQNAFAANAQVLQAVDESIRTLLVAAGGRG